MDLNQAKATLLMLSNTCREEDFIDSFYINFWKDSFNRISAMNSIEEIINECGNLLDYMDDYKEGYIKEEVSNELKNIIETLY